MLNYEFYPLDLQSHADAGTLVNATGNYVNAYTGATEAFTSTETLSPTMKTFYDTALLKNVNADLVFAQLGLKQPLPANRGRIVEWRKWNRIPPALTPLVEGVIPTGEKLSQTSLNASLTQHGKYTTITDLIDLHATDNVIMGAVDELSASARKTQDTLTRNELLKGANAIYADKLTAGAYTSTPAYRHALDSGCKLTVDMVHKAKTFLIKQNTPAHSGNTYIAVIHPSVKYDLIKSDDWVDVHKYSATTAIFNGEIGQIYGVRFLETTEAPIYVGDTLWTSAQRYLSVSAYSDLNGSPGTPTSGYGVGSDYRLTVTENFDADATAEAAALALVGRVILIEDTSASSAAFGTYTICGVDKTNNYIYLEEDPSDSVTPANGDFLVPGEGGLETKTGNTQNAIYCTLFFGKDAFGIIDPAGGGLKMYIKGAAEVGGPLEQFSSAGYKFETATKILYEERILRVESCSSYSSVDAANDTL